MDYERIGSFISSLRKEKNLTQAKLAEKIFVSEKTISKWENGKGVPDTTTLPLLCEVLSVSINELLNGEKIKNQDYTQKAEKKLLEMRKLKENSDKHLLTMEIVIGVLSVSFLLVLSCIASYIEMPKYLRIILVVIGLSFCIIGTLFALKIEQVAGYYECKHCFHKHIPSFRQISFSMHINRTRLMKCPNCGKKSWQKKVIK